VVLFVAATHDPGPAAVGPRSSTGAAATGPRSASPTAGVSLLPSPIGVLLPGATVVGQYSGTGSSTVPAGPPSIGPGRQLVIDAICEGAGPATVGPVRIAACTGASVGAVVDAAAARSLRVSVAGATRWRFALVDEPEHGTNGALQYPVATALSDPHGPGTIAAGTGRGAATIALPAVSHAPGPVDLRLLLTCRGAGVAFTSADGRFDGDYTNTCFAGWSYEFDVSRAALPGTLHVQAASGTSWQLVVLAA
jgi:hypothetical protein